MLQALKTYNIFLIESWQEYSKRDYDTILLDLKNYFIQTSFQHELTDFFISDTPLFTKDV